MNVRAERVRQSRLQTDSKWRNAQFVVSYPDWGDRGRMRGSSAFPTGTLHRPKCRTLSEDRRLESLCPSNVFDVPLEQFRKDADNYAVGNSYKICQHCCADIEVKGQNMIKAPIKPVVAPLSIVDEPYRHRDGTEDHSAWAPLHRIHDFLYDLAGDEETTIQTAVQAKELADLLARTIPRLGGGAVRK